MCDSLHFIKIKVSNNDGAGVLLTNSNVLVAGQYYHNYHYAYRKKELCSNAAVFMF